MGGPLHYDKPMDIEGAPLSADEARKVRAYLEAAAKKIETFQVNNSYRFAFKSAARIIRQLKPD